MMIMVCYFYCYVTLAFIIILRSSVGFGNHIVLQSSFVPCAYSSPSGHAVQLQINYISVTFIISQVSTLTTSGPCGDS